MSAPIPVPRAVTFGRAWVETLALHRAEGARREPDWARYLQAHRALDAALPPPANRTGVALTRPRR